MSETRLKGVLGGEKWADEIKSPITHEGVSLRDWDRDGLCLVNIEYLRSMFDVEMVREADKPIRIALTEKPDHFAKRS